MSDPSSLKCSSCGFSVFNRRHPKCERCGAQLPQGMVYSSEEVVVLRQREEEEEALACQAERRSLRPARHVADGPGGWLHPGDSGGDTSADACSSDTGASCGGAD